jgi:uncharacterized protein YndB with AHSA1/START domain
MTVTSVVPDQQARTLTLTAEYPAPVEQVWQLWADPRLLERWWGPPTYPATFTELDLRTGGRAAYYMTSPEGDRYNGWWSFTDVTAPSAVEFDDGFADEHGTPSPTMPVTHARVTIEDAGDGTTRMVMSSTFPTDEAMEQLMTMGMVEGLTMAVGQIDDLLAELVSR